MLPYPRKTKHAVNTSPVRWLVLGLCLLGAGVIGILDVETGWELSLFVLYGIPIFFAVWYWTLPVGIVLSLTCTIIWWLANKAENPYTTWWGYQVAALSRFAYFSIVVVAGMILKKKQDSDKAQIEALERTQELEREIVRVSEREQRRIGQDLHDGLCQHLAAIGCAAKSLADDLGNEARPETATARELVELLKGAVVEARDVARGMFPVQIDNLGLAAALDEMACAASKLTNVAVTFLEIGEARIHDPEISMHLYRITQEAMANAISHGKPKHIVITLDRTEEMLRLIIEDDGTGFFITQGETKGMGLRTMAYRARLIGATLEVSERDGPGTCIRCELSLDSSNQPALIE
jgi:signal transduction histidine kinase